MGYHVVMLLGEQQNPSHVCFIMIQGVELWRGHMERSFLREPIVQSLIQRQQVHIVHSNIISVVPALCVAHVDERGSVKPVKHIVVSIVSQRFI